MHLRPLSMLDRRRDTRIITALGTSIPFHSEIQRHPLYPLLLIPFLTVLYQSLIETPTFQYRLHMD